MPTPYSPPMPTKRRKPAFTKTEIKSYSDAANDAGLDCWAVERTDKDGVVTRFEVGAVSPTEAGQSEWDQHDKR